MAIFLMAVVMAAMGALQGLIAAWVFGWAAQPFVIVGAIVSVLTYLFFVGASIVNEDLERNS